jgi:hypothetical protein
MIGVCVWLVWRGLNDVPVPKAAQQQQNDATDTGVDAN